MNTDNIKLYEGQDKYIFVSYCHKDWEKVYPVLEMLSEQGYRIWYDQGIHPGNQWPEIVAGRLNDSFVFMAFLSENYMKSQNCVREIHFAVAKEKDLLSVYLEPVQLSLGIEMQLSVSQAVKKIAYPTEEAFYKQILLADVLASCKEPEAELDEVTEEQETSAVKAEKTGKDKTIKEKAVKETSGQKSGSKKGMIIGLLAAVLVFAVFGFFIMNKEPASNLNIIMEADLTAFDLDHLEAHYEADELDGKLVKDEKENYLLNDSNQTRGVLVTMDESMQMSENAHSNYLIFHEADYSRKLQYTLDVLNEYYTPEIHASKKDERENYLESGSYGKVNASSEIQTMEINGMIVEYIVISYSKNDTRWDGHVQAWMNCEDFIVNCEIDLICDGEDVLEVAVLDTLELAFNNVKIQ